MIRWVVVLATLLAPLATAAPIRILVAIGNDVGLPGEPTLRFATHDARRVGDVFGTLGGVAPSRRMVLANAPWTVVEGGLQQAAGLAKGRNPAEITLVVYFSGHGDEDSIHVAGTRVPVARLAALADAVPAKTRILILDSCRSEGRDKGLIDAPVFDIAVRPPDAMTGTVIVRSSSRGEAAQESDELGGAVFTHYFVSALRGAGDGDGDKRVTFDEAYSFAFDRTLRRSAATTGGVQHPAAVVRTEGAGPLVLTRTKRATALLDLPAGRDTLYLVYELPAGTVTAEAWGLTGLPTTLALPGGRFLVQRRRAGQFAAAEVALPYGGRAAMTDADFTEVPLGVVAAKGGRLRLHPHEVSVTYGFATGDRSELGQRLDARYGYRAAEALAVTAGVSIGQVDWQADYFELRDRWVGADVSLEWRASPAPALEFSLGGGAQLRWTAQRQTRSDAERLALAGYTTEEDFYALGGGPTVDAGMAVALGGPLAAVLTIRVDGSFVTEQDGVAFRVAAAVQLGVSAAF